MQKYSLKNFPKKILVMTADRLGDAIFITPGIRLLKQYFPDTQIDVLAFTKLAAAVFKDNPYINTVYIESNKNAILSLISQFPLALCLMEEMHKFIGNLPNNVITIHEPDITRHRTVQVIQFINHWLAVEKKHELMGYDLFIRPEDTAKVLKLLSSNQIDINNDIIIAFQLGCSRLARRGWKFWSNKRHLHKKVWPIKYYAELAQKLSKTNTRIKLVLVGSAKERYLARMFLKLFPQAIDFIGQTSVQEMAALMDLSHILVTHDTGTLHIACARKCPLIALFAATSVNFTGPYPSLPQFKVLQAESMAEINPEQVYLEILNSLKMKFAP